MLALINESRTWSLTILRGLRKPNVSQRTAGAFQKDDQFLNVGGVRAEPVSDEGPALGVVGLIVIKR